VTDQGRRKQQANEGEEKKKGLNTACDVETAAETMEDGAWGLGFVAWTV
jgi:hypothetical protein